MRRDEVDLDEILAFAVGLAKEAGDHIRKGQAARYGSDTTEEYTKSNSVDLVTDIDKAVEHFIQRRITEAYPSHAFIGEETYAGGDISDVPTWIVDPIDGTTNFIHGYPMVATSIGLAIKGKPVVGVVYNPFLNLLYSAAEGRGAYLNLEQKLPLTGRPRRLPDMHSALVHVDIGGSRERTVLDSRLKTYGKLAGQLHEGGRMVHSLRSIGCASMNICFIASGAQDLHWEIGAGLCILTEAGGAAFGGKNSKLCGTVDANLLAGRKYLFIRAITPEEGETNFSTQRRLCEEFYTLTDDIEP